MIMRAGVSFALFLDMTSPALRFQESRVPSIAASHVPNRVSGSTAGDFEVWTKE